MEKLFSSYIIVNATALDKSGALSILKQFLSNIPPKGFNWLIFVSDSVDLNTSNDNVRIEPISGVKKSIRRFIWDVYGLRKWLRKNKIDAIANLSLQNTGFRSSNTKAPSFIYYHQSISFFKRRWNPLKKEERSFWFYKNIYPFFVRLFLKKETVVFVQLEFVKQQFSRFFNHDKLNIHVISPSILFSVSENKILLDNKKINVFYPSTGHFYKNHIVLEEIAKELEEQVNFYFTLPKPSKHNPNIHYLGFLEYKKVVTMYNSCDALVFPSYIETFGLPLIEAALVGLPVIVADLPYAREVLSGYEGAIFVEHNNPEAWKIAIKNIKKGERYNPLDISFRPSWNKLFNTIENKLNN